MHFSENDPKLKKVSEPSQLKIAFINVYVIFWITYELKGDDETESVM